MFTKTIKKVVLDSSLVNLLTRPHGVDRYAELLAPTWTIGGSPAKADDVQWTTPGGSSVVLVPNRRPFLD